MKPDNAEISFKCGSCGHTFSRNAKKEMDCPSCGFTCTDDSCESLGASNEDY